MLSYVAVGARSVENQFHRLTASGLDIPVGMKNPTSGDLSVMMNSIRAAQHPHTFVYSGWEVNSAGNTLAHAILRGSVDKNGQAIPNYHYEDLIKLCDLYAKSGLENPAVIVDTNHSNSAKKFDFQTTSSPDLIVNTTLEADTSTKQPTLLEPSYLISVVKSIESPTPKLDAAGVNESATLDASQSGTPLFFSLVGDGTSLREIAYTSA